MPAQPGEIPSLRIPSRFNRYFNHPVALVRRKGFVAVVWGKLMLD
ncbi:MAG: hypothetical protein OXD42_06285 [Rhodospirillaceae bacterium]|nr:hypothetical protein [Rhodospirillaceae bacterium]